MELILSQSWLPEPEEGFQPGTASITWKNGTLSVSIDLTDDEVMTTASAHQQKLWEHGDVAELFVQRVGEIGYDEYQISPNGFSLGLHYPNISGVAAVRSGERKIDEFFSKTSFIATAVKTDSGWRADFTITLPCSPTDRILISCCRYDAAKGRSAIISSTSPHPVRDFHRPQEWHTINPEPDQSFGRPS
jgi:hypothetical protein